MTAFHDIKITELDDAASGLAESGPLMNMVFQRKHLSIGVSYSTTAGRRALSLRRKAIVGDRTLTSICMAYELQGQIDQLNEVISATNRSYRLITEEAAARQDVELRDLKASLRYD
jgi:hypothetical protein